MPVKRPPGLALDKPAPITDQSVNITDTMTLQVKDENGNMIRVKETGRQGGNLGPNANAEGNGADPKGRPKVESLLDKILFDDLRVLDMLGAGSQGKVRKAQHRITGELYALKSIAFSDDKDATRDVLRAELKRLAAMQHPNIVTSFEAYFREGKLYIVLELMDCGTLTHIMKKCPEGLPESVTAYIAKEFLLGMKHLHTSGVIHRDLKPANLLINSKGAVKISDFGVAKEFGTKQQSAETLAPVGSTPYMSPERVKGEPYSFSCDVWSCGLTIAEAAIGQYPFANLKGNTFALCQAIAGGTAKIGWDMMGGGRKPSAALVNFVDECMKPAKGRPSAEELLKHPFLALAEGIPAGAFGRWFSDPSKSVDEAKADFLREMPQPVKVGALACQMSSYLRTLTTKVVSCVPVSTTETKVAGGGASSPVTGFDVVFEDSVLFPEGGGQPSDLGWINGTVSVTKVRRVGDTCVVTTEEPLQVGAEVEMKVDWDRRLDQMQHHTAQHVVTAIVEKELGLPTDSWAYSHPTCYIQVPSPALKSAETGGEQKVPAAGGKKGKQTEQFGTIDPNDLKKVDTLCNSLIFNQTPVIRHVFPSREEVPASRSRGIPADVNGPIRLIEVEGVDTCTCCGTHVENLSQLQLIKILHTEAKAGTTKIHFVVGQRAVNYFSTMYEREKALMKELSASADSLCSNSERRGKELNDASKSSKKLLAEVATLVAPTVAEQAVNAPAGGDASIVFTYLREDGDMDFLGTVATSIKEKEQEKGEEGSARNYLLACGSLKGGPGEGALMMWGPNIGPLAVEKILPALDGKGGQSKTGFRAKCHMKGWKQLVKDLAKVTEAPKDKE